MDQKELEKCKNDAVYFAEKYMGTKLTLWQKAYLKVVSKNKSWLYKLKELRMIKF